MDPSGSAGQDESLPATPTPPPPPPAPLQRRLSMEEDMLYRNIISTPIRRPTSRQPSFPPSPDELPPYELEAGSIATTSNGNGGRCGQTTDQSRGTATTGRTSDEALEPLPKYSNSIALESVFRKKHEIEGLTKRAEDRRWHTNYVVLQGTALHIYSAKKDWGWGWGGDGPGICSDNPPWIRKAKLEKTYSLLHADAGIAADYKKRRYVIRVRAETDQFLLCCVELSTFIRWLEGLFAAIDVAAPIEDRDFPRDMSMPRIQRVRWFRSHTGAVFPVTTPEPNRETSQDSQPEDDDDDDDDDDDADNTSYTARNTDASSRLPVPTPAPSRPRMDQDPQHISEAPGFHPRHGHADLMMTESHPNPAINPHTGKWFPEHLWTEAHDLLYAKLCYSNLFFASPRKTNYVISKGKLWFVNWDTNQMIRVLPPSYDDFEGYFGPWQVVQTENRRI